MSESVPASAAQRTAQGGKLIGIVAYGVIVAAITLVFTLQILDQAFGFGAKPSDEPCATGLARLSEAVERARQSAAATSESEAPLERYREALQPEWSSAMNVRETCRADQSFADGFQRLERLRYAEEQAILHASRDLASARLDVERLRERLKTAKASQ